MNDQSDADLIRDHAFRWIDNSYDETRELIGRQNSTGFDASTNSEIAEHGWLGVLAPEACGGTDGGLPEMAAVMEAIGRGLVMEPVLSVGGIVAPLLSGLDTPQAKDILRDVVAGKTTAVLCHFERDAGFDRGLSSSQCDAEDGGFVVTAPKAPAIDVVGADLLIVTARDPDGKTGVFAVAPDTPSVSVETFRSVDQRGLGAVTLDQCHLPATARLDVDGAGELVEGVIENAGILISAEAIGAMQVVIDETAEYLKIRNQFGQPLSSFQVLQHRMVDMLLHLEEARGALDGALDAGEGQDRLHAIVLSRIVGGRAARYVAEQAVQLHGGIGMTDETRISRYFRRLLMCESLFGDPEWNAERYRQMRAVSAS
ncbi:putative acyl-CoA dehydrogenase [Pseudooceanicola batsensis HTCC2597]|uniref:Putative acyl-CoA dehydrogenase n=1 Tax=Pseudooceanicola batsensis (strain ATCC BAA-863 / DSM 15984 / KCTC 12145 / HTCC2597) TaxID=252305 RepID=A3TT35_PSEBH|nr:acyl-CoA dehydrogenase family protein [Pseudooceanicola batsensis]EAQ04812.1 putative acyl-CoA dehydrogenase [Pseudooceanicola batsensis HTCC2597]